MQIIIRVHEEHTENSNGDEKCPQVTQPRDQKLKSGSMSLLFEGRLTLFQRVMDLNKNSFEH